MTAPSKIRPVNLEHGDTLRLWIDGKEYEHVAYGKQTGSEVICVDKVYGPVLPKDGVVVVAERSKL